MKNAEMKRVAFQGELGAYSEVAASEFFNRDVTVIPKPSFSKVFDAGKVKVKRNTESYP